MAQDHSPSPERRRSERATAKAARQSALNKAAKSARRKKGRDGKLNYFIKPLQLTKGLLNQHIRGVLQETQSTALFSNLFIIPQFIARESDLALKPLQTEF